MTGKKKGAKTGKSSGSGRGCGGGEIQVSDRAGALWRADDLAEDSRDRADRAAEESFGKGEKRVGRIHQ